MCTSSGAKAAVTLIPLPQEKMTGLGTDIVANSPEQFAQYLREETAKWSKIVRDAGIKLEI